MQPLAGAWRKRPTRVGEWRVAGKCQVSQNSNYKLSDYRAIPHFLIFDSADKGWPPRSQALKVLQLRPQHLLVKEMIALKA